MTEAQSTTDSPNPLIFAGKVNGTPVFNAAGERIGHIQDLAIGKMTGQVAYAILSFGGFLGIGEKHHPVPWSILTYDPVNHGYIVPRDKEQLRLAPSYDLRELADLGDLDERRKTIAEHWGPFI
jgi:hypothetical protein